MPRVMGLVHQKELTVTLLYLLTNCTLHALFVCETDETALTDTLKRGQAARGHFTPERPPPF